MTDYTPQTDEVEEAYIGYYTHSDAARMNPVLQREFNRWLAAHDKEVLEKAAERIARIGCRLHDMPDDECYAPLDRVLAAVLGDGEQA